MLMEKIKANYVLNSLNLGIKIGIKKKILGFINCPINKKETFGNKKFGITEFLSKKLGVLAKK